MMPLSASTTVPDTSQKSSTELMPPDDVAALALEFELKTNAPFLLLDEPSEVYPASLHTCGANVLSSRVERSEMAEGAGVPSILGWTLTREAGSMSTTMRAKLQVSSVIPSETNEQETLHFHGVGRNEAYPEDGSDENNTFAKFTPSAHLEIIIMNPALLGKFKPGDTFYVDFTPVA